jgi:hypothetical protein
MPSGLHRTCGVHHLHFPFGPVTGAKSHGVGSPVPTLRKLREGLGTPLVGPASKIKSLGHPASRYSCFEVWIENPFMG